jgi:hypothetical protein
MVIKAHEKWLERERKRDSSIEDFSYFALILVQEQKKDAERIC